MPLFVNKAEALTTIGTVSLDIVGLSLLAILKPTPTVGEPTAIFLTIGSLLFPVSVAEWAFVYLSCRENDELPHPERIWGFWRKD